MRVAVEAAMRWRAGWLAASLALVPACIGSTSGGGGGGSLPPDFSDADAAVAGADGSGTARTADGSAARGGDSANPPNDSAGAGTDAAKDAAPDVKADVAPDAKPDTKPATGGMTVAGCPDGDFSETPADPDGDIAALVAGYNKAAATDFVQAALGVRYPLGQKIMVEGAKSPMGGGKNCIQQFFQASQATTAAGALGQASTLVHECGHLYDLASSGGGHTYFLNEQINYTCNGLSYQGANKGFARSLIKGDGFDATWPPCAQLGQQGCDGYAPIYLSGDPKDGKFDSGDQGYDMLLEEVTQYVNSLATDYAFSNQQPYSTSAEDGILTFLWYMTRYLHMARLQYPDTYAFMSSDPCWRKATLTIWGRAWFYLDKSKGNAKLNLKGAMLRGLVSNADLLDEIQRLRQADGCQ